MKKLSAIKLLVVALFAVTMMACAKVEEKKVDTVGEMYQQLDKALDKIDGTHNFVAFRKAKKEFWEAYNAGISKNSAIELTEQDQTKLTETIQKLYTLERTKLEKFGKKDLPSEEETFAVEAKIDSAITAAKTFNDLKAIDRLQK